MPRPHAGESLTGRPDGNSLTASPCQPWAPKLVGATATAVTAAIAKTTFTATVERILLLRM